MLLMVRAPIAKGGEPIIDVHLHGYPATDTAAVRPNPVTGRPEGGHQEHLSLSRPVEALQHHEGL
jgi:hypothetical protein